MKWWIGVLVLVCVGGSIALTWRAHRASPSVGPSTMAADGVMGVDAFMRGVDSHRGPVRVAGVVAAVAADRQFFTLIDRREFADCGRVTCAELTLPVQWDGPLPATRDIVQVSGEVKEVAASAPGEQARLIFVANTVGKAQ